MPEVVEAAGPWNHRLPLLENEVVAHAAVLRAPVHREVENAHTILELLEAEVLSWNDCIEPVAILVEPKHLLLVFDPFLVSAELSIPDRHPELVRRRAMSHEEALAHDVVDLRGHGLDEDVGALAFDLVLDEGRGHLRVPPKLLNVDRLGHNR